MPEAARHGTGERNGEAAFWLGWLLGPAAWALHQNVSFALTGWVCDTGHYWVLHAVSFAALAIAANGAIVAWHGRRTAGESRSNEAGRSWSRRRFMATGGAVICLLSFAGVLVESMPNFVLGACAGAT